MSDLTDSQRERFEAAAERGLATRRAIREAITPLVVAVDRLIDNWAESDEAVRRGLWRAMAAASTQVADACGVYPLDGEVVAAPSEPTLPGVPLESGFDHRPLSEHPELALSDEARQSVLDKMDSVDEARRRAAESSSTYVIGSVPPVVETPTAPTWSELGATWSNGWGHWYWAGTAATAWPTGAGSEWCVNVYGGHIAFAAPTEDDARRFVAGCQAARALASVAPPAAETTKEQQP